MTETLKILGQACPSASTPGQLYAVPGSVAAVLSRLVICNQNSSIAKARVWALKSGDTLGTTQYLVWDMALVPGDPPGEVLAGFTIATGDALWVQSDIGGVSFNAVGSEVG